MKGIMKGIGLCLALSSLCAVGCKKKEMEGAGTDASKITIWVSEADKPFATEVVKAFKAKNPDKKYNIVIDIQGENDVATRVLNDVESAADVYSCSNDQISKLINGDALAKIAGTRLQRVESANSKESMESVKATVGGVEGVYGMP
jgi:ABC-type glycerol-3-phosphate transport system substrate-binding protein